MFDVKSRNQLLHAHTTSAPQHAAGATTKDLSKGTTKDLTQRHNKRPCRQCDKGTFVGYATDTRCYLVQDDETTRVDVVFDEKSANLHLHAHTTPAPLPTSAPTKEFLAAARNDATTRRPSTHTHSKHDVQ